MGKRKSRKVIRKTPLPKLESEFNCPFCGNTKCINVKLDSKLQIGRLWCRICNVDYSQSRIPRLFQSVDLYSAWLDECVLANSPSRIRQCQIEEYGEEEEVYDETAEESYQDIPEQLQFETEQQEELQNDDNEYVNQPSDDGRWIDENDLFTENDDDDDDDHDQPSEIDEFHGDKVVEKGEMNELIEGNSEPRIKHRLKRSIRRISDDDIEGIFDKNIFNRSNVSEVPEDNVEVPEDNVEVPEDNVEVPEDNVEVPEDNVEVPEDNVESLEDSVADNVVEVFLLENEIEVPAIKKLRLV